MAAVAAVVAAAGAGLWAGQTGLVRLPIGPPSTAMTGVAQPDAKVRSSTTAIPTEALLLARRRRPPTADGHSAVHAGEDVSFDPPKPAATEPRPATCAATKIIHYRNPMGLPDISPVPKKDSMGMDYIPVYEGDADEGARSRSRPARSSALASRPSLSANGEIGRNIHAPGVVEIDERRVTVVAPRFDGFIDTVARVTSGTHVRKGDPLMTVFGQELSIRLPGSHRAVRPER